MLTFPVVYLPDMYSKVIFQNHIQEDTDVELPASVQACDVSGRKEKCLVSELEVCSVVVTPLQE